MTSIIQRIADASRSRPLFTKIISFAVIGVGNAAIDMAVFGLTYGVIGLPLVPANVLAWLVAVSVSYVMNTTFTFRAETGRTLKRKDYLSFVASGTLGVFCATSTMLLILLIYDNVLVAKVASIFVGFIVNFTMSHLVVFRLPEKS